MRRVHVLAAALLSALAVVAAGCGGGGGGTTTTTTSATSAWANGFCGAFVTWKQQADTIVSQFKSLDSLSKANVQKAADDMNTATSKLLDDLKGLGAPDTPSGQQIKTSIDDLSSTFQTQTDAIKTSVDNASGLTGAITAGQDVLASLAKMNTALQSTISTVENADAGSELQSALQSSPDCQSLSK